MKRTLKIIYYVLVCIVCIELAFWVLGYRPYNNTNYKVESKPANAYQGDSILGIRLNPGIYQITLNDSISFTASHDSLGRRVVPGVQSAQDSLPKIHLFGCSFTYGYGVNDYENFAALIQSSYPNYAVQNHAVIGYGTIHAYLQLLNEIKLGKNDLVLICFSTYHFVRNTLAQTYRSDLRIGFENSSKSMQKKMETARFPFKIDCSDSIYFSDWSSMYNNWFGREYSPSINFVQTKYDEIKDRKIDHLAITASIFKSIGSICKRNESQLAVICLDSNSDTDSLNKLVNEFAWCNVNFDFTKNDLINFPYDTHPNAKGHQLIFNRINTFLNGLLAE